MDEAPSPLPLLALGSLSWPLSPRATPEGGTASPPAARRRIGGSSLGGSSFWGLVRLLTSCSTFDEVIRLTERGASSKVDMLVSDIYGDDGARDIGLGGDVIAASFGEGSG